MFGERIKSLRKRQGMTQTQLARVLGLSQQAVGKWETGNSAPDQATLQRLADIFDVSIDFLLGRPEAGVFPFRNLTAEYQIPVLGTVKAGYDALAYQEDLGTEPATVKNPEEFFYLIVRGDSMEPRIFSGDLALVHKQPNVESGELAVVLVDGDEGTLKRVLRKDGAVILQPFNPRYQTQIYIGEEINRLRIVGKVVETKSKW